VALDAFAHPKFRASLDSEVIAGAVNILLQRGRGLGYRESQRVVEPGAIVNGAARIRINSGLRFVPIPVPSSAFVRRDTGPSGHYIAGSQ